MGKANPKILLGKITEAVILPDILQRFEDQTDHIFHIIFVHAFNGSMHVTERKRNKR
jgi:hypothetical protein